MSELKKQIIETFGFTSMEYESIKDFFQSTEIKKGDYFLREGQYSTRLAFVEQGVLREFLYVNDKEVTKWFSSKGYFAVDLSSFVFNQKSKVDYQALTDVQVMYLSKEKYDKIGEIIPRWNNLEKLFLAKCFTVLENRIVSYLSMNAEERYTQFFEFHPELFNQVPLIFIASMLGMSPETLSRIRAKQTNLTS